MPLGRQGPLNVTFGELGNMKSVSKLTRMNEGLKLPDFSHGRGVQKPFATTIGEISALVHQWVRNQA